MTEQLAPEIDEPGIGSDVDAAADAVPRWLGWLVLGLIVSLVSVAGIAARYALMAVPAGASAKSASTEPAAEPSLVELTRAVHSDPNNQAARLKLAAAYQKKGQNDMALAQYDKVLARAPKNLAALYNRGVIYMQLGSPKKAERALWEVLDVDPTHVQAAADLGRYYAAKGQYKSVVAAVRLAVKDNPWSADLQYLTGLAYEKLGEPKRAKLAYTEALRYAPHMVEAKEGLDRIAPRK